jgi:hypothetical protein
MLVSDYTFNTNTRMNDDECDISQRSMQNNGYSNYLLQNYKPDCPMSSPIAFALSQPNVNFTGSKQVGIGGCNIDENSKLQLTDLSKDKPKLNLHQRLFSTVPYLGYGPHNPFLESKVQHGEPSNNRKCSISTTELSHIQYRHTPMIDSLRQTITNPANLVEESASAGWMRGGIPSRELVKETNYN